MNDWEFQRRKREYELEIASALIPECSRILEIGAGAGWQAQALREKGHEVVAVDIPTSIYKSARIWPVIEYDGEHLPFSDGSFNVIFSSNVLEHIPNCERFQEELSRVLQQNGVAIHIMPTSSWRIWTNITFYLHRLRSVLKLMWRGRTAGSDDKGTELDVEGTGEQAGVLWYLRKLFIPNRHGVTGSSISEIYFFSSYRWKRLFNSTGWQVEGYYPIRLFYTGHRIAGRGLNFHSRHLASALLGSSSQVFLLKKGHRLIDIPQNRRYG